jgi:hypothetical protein
MDNPVLGMIMQIGSEVTAGDGNGVTGANKRLRNTRLAFAPTWEDTQEYKGEGQSYVNNIVPGYEHVEGDSTCPLSFTESCYVLESAAKKLPDPTVGAQGEYTRVYRDGIPGIDTIRTYVVQKGNGRANFQYNYVFWNSIDLLMNNRGATIGGGAFGQRVGVIPDMTTSPTKVANVLAPPKDIGLFFSYSMAGLDSEPIRVGRAFDFHFVRGPKFNLITPMNEDLESYATIVENEDGVDATVTVTLGMDVYTPKTVSARANSATYLYGDVVKRAGSTHTVVFKSVQGGAAAASEPAAMATAVPGDLVTDGSVIWLTIAYDFRDPISMAAARAGETFYLKCRALGPIIGGAVRYLLEWKGSVQVPTPFTPESHDGLSVNTYELRVVEDETAGYPWEIKVINKLAVV